MDADKYSYRVIWSEEDKEFVGLCAEFPGLSWLAKDQGGALRGIMALVRDCMADMKENGEVIPEPILCQHSADPFIVRTTSDTQRQFVLLANET